VPTAAAGAPQTVVERSQVALSGSGTDSDGSVASFAWVQISGPSVSVSGASTAHASFTAPSLSAPATLTFRFTVTDNHGATATDTTTIAVNPDAALNDAPVANAGPDQDVAQGTTVTLSGAASSDQDGSIASFSWTQRGGSTWMTASAIWGKASISCALTTWDVA
jgi:hypothetical protein